jgi:murein DD-endopeptidase MepM/ murein hydrolase activator NlpD
MNFQKPLLALVFSSLFSLIPAQSFGKEQVLALPLASLTPEDTLNQYLAPMTEYGSGHRGIDLPARIGDQVFSPATGELSFVGKVGYRNVVSVKFGNSLTASMEPVCSEILEGTQVDIDQVIGFVCQPDQEYVWHCVESCLHFGTRSEAGYFSPLTLIGGLAPSKLAYYARG